MTRKEKLYNFIKDNSLTPFTLNEIIFMLNIKEEDVKELQDILYHKENK